MEVYEKTEFTVLVAACLVVADFLAATEVFSGVIRGSFQQQKRGEIWIISFRL